MPEGVFYKGMSHAPAWAVIEQHHLSWFIDPVDEYEIEEDAGFELGLGLE
jgi:(2Fe-2S) ferredoxin